DSNLALLAIAVPVAQTDEIVRLRCRQALNSEHAANQGAVSLDKLERIKRTRTKLAGAGFDPVGREVGVAGGIRLAFGRSRQIVAQALERDFELRIACNLGLAFHQPRVPAVEGEQLVVGALFDQAALVKDENAIRVAERAQAMRDRERG